jgi:hypothetical protein
VASKVNYLPSFNAEVYNASSFASTPTILHPSMEWQLLYRLLRLNFNADYAYWYFVVHFYDTRQPFRWPKSLALTLRSAFQHPCRITSNPNPSCLGRGWECYKGMKYARLMIPKEEGWA